MATQCGPVSGSYQWNSSTPCHWTYGDLKDNVLANQHLNMKWIFDIGLIAGQCKGPTCSNNMVLSECRQIGWHEVGMQKKRNIEMAQTHTFHQKRKLVSRKQSHPQGDLEVYLLVDSRPQSRPDKETTKN